MSSTSASRSSAALAEPTAAPRPRDFAPPRRSATATRLVLAGLSLLAFALRAHHLAAQSLWSDEDITLDRAGQTLAELLAGLPVEQAPGYFVLMRFWTRLAGDGDLALRYPSLLAGVLAVPLAGYLGARLADRDTGLILAAIVAINPFLVYYGQEARMYALLMSLALAAVAAMLRATRTHQMGWWAICGALVAATLYTHYYGAIIIAGLAGWALFDLASWDRWRLRGWLLAGLVAALLFAPWLPRALGVLQFEGWRSALPLAEAPMAHATDWFAGRGLPDGHPIVWIYLSAAALGLLLMLFITAVEIGFAGSRRHAGDRYSARRGAALQLLPLVAYGLIVLRTAEFEAGGPPASIDYDPRYAIAALPGVYLAVAWGLSLLAWLIGLPVYYLLTFYLPAGLRARFDALLRREDKIFNTLMAGLLIGLAALPGLRDLYGNPASQKQDYRGFVARVEAEASHEDTVLLLDGPNYGLTRRYEIEDSPVKIVNLHSSGNLERGAEAREAYVDELSSIFPHIWLAEDGARLGEAKAWLDAQTYPVSEEGFQDITLHRYYRPVLAEKDPALVFDSQSSISARFLTPLRDGNDDLPGLGPPSRITCEGFGISPVAAGEMLPIALRCRAAKPIDRELKVSARLTRLTDEGSPDEAPPLISIDRRPVNWTRPTSGWLPSEWIRDRHALRLPRGLTPGEYGVQIVFYDEETGAEDLRLTGRVTVEPAR